MSTKHHQVQPPRRPSPPHHPHITPTVTPTSPPPSPPHHPHRHPHITPTSPLPSPWHHPHRHPHITPTSSSPSPPRHPHITPTQCQLHLICAHSVMYQQCSAVCRLCLQDDTITDVCTLESGFLGIAMWLRLCHYSQPTIVYMHDVHAYKIPTNDVINSFVFACTEDWPRVPAPCETGWIHPQIRERELGRQTVRCVEVRPSQVTQ